MFKKNDTIKVGDKVMVVIEGAVQELEIVDLPQGDPKKGKISFLSPLARAILGHKYPELVKVKLPNGDTLDCELVKPLIS